jgi:hypothetical protein
MRHQSPVWKDVNVLALSENMRLKNSSDSLMSDVNDAFASTLLKIEEGKFQTNHFGILSLKGVPHHTFNSPPEGEQILTDFVYLELLEMASSTVNQNYLNNRCILAPLNRDVCLLNKKITRKWPGELCVSKLIDLPDPEGIDTLPEECLNKLLILGLPKHLIYLKVGMLVVIMQNLYIKQGVCNGLRLLVLTIGHGFLMGQCCHDSKH